jgi:hypothetical protein
MGYATFALNGLIAQIGAFARATTYASGTEITVFGTGERSIESTGYKTRGFTTEFGTNAFGSAPNQILYTL